MAYLLAQLTHAVVLTLIVALPLYGWVENIIKIVHTDHVSGMLVARCIGAFLAPIGAVLGFF